MSLLGVNLSAPIVDRHPVPHILTLYTVRVLYTSVVQQAKSYRAAVASVRFFLNVFKILFAFKERALSEECSEDLRFLNSSKNFLFFFLLNLCDSPEWKLGVAFSPKKKTPFVFNLLKNSLSLNALVIETAFLTGRHSVSCRFAFQSFSLYFVSCIFKIC